jgi:hypothetical protein
MAQLVARLVRIEKVRGSNPLSSTIFQQFRTYFHMLRMAREIRGGGYIRDRVLAPDQAAVYTRPYWPVLRARSMAYWFVKGPRRAPRGGMIRRIHRDA